MLNTQDATCYCEDKVGPLSHSILEPLGGVCLYNVKSKNDSNIHERNQTKHISSCTALFWHISTSNIFPFQRKARRLACLKSRIPCCRCTNFFNLPCPTCPTKQFSCQNLMGQVHHPDAHLMGPLTHLPWLWMTNCLDILSWCQVQRWRSWCAQCWRLSPHAVSAPMWVVLLHHEESKSTLKKSMVGLTAPWLGVLTRQHLHRDRVPNGIDLPTDIALVCKNDDKWSSTECNLPDKFCLAPDTCIEDVCANRGSTWRNGDVESGQHNVDAISALTGVRSEMSMTMSYNKISIKPHQLLPQNHRHWRYI